MSQNKTNLTKNKKIKTSFTAKQPGYINVAGESFFLSDDDNAFSTKLYDDSIKGELAFQDLFLKPFSSEEQTSLRNIYRTIFGSGSIIGKKGLSLPCEEKEVELLVKSLIYRRDKLIQQIKTYGILLSNDMHARYLREHLLRLNKLIDDDIPNTLAPCKDTIIDDRFGRLSLNNTRMLKLLEIFAFLLAQGKDPLESLINSDPSAIDILPKMAKQGAKKLRDYETAYAKENPGKTPQYTDTLKKIRRVLTDQTPEPATDSELLQVITDIEKDLGIQDSSGSASDRKTRILNEIKILKQAVIEEGNCKRALAAVTTERESLALKVKEFEMKAGPTPTESIDALKKKITDLTTEITALRSQYDEDTRTTIEVQTKLKQLEKQKTELQRQLDSRPTLEALNELQRQLGQRAEITPEALTALQAELQTLRGYADITPEDLARLQAELDRLRAGIPIDLASLQAEIDRLRGRADITPAALAALQAQLAELQQRPTAEALATLQAQVTELQQRPTAEALAAVQTSLEAAQKQLAERAEITPAALTALQAQVTDLQQRPTAEALATVQASLEAIQKQLAERAEITPAALTALQAQVTDLQQRPTAEALATVQASLEAAQKQLAERAEITPAALAALQAELNRLRSRPAVDFTGTQDNINALRGRANITPQALASLQEELTRLRTRIAMTPEDFEVYRLAKEKLDNLNRILEGITPERLTELLNAEQERNRLRAQLDSYRSVGVSPDQIRTLQQQVKEKEAELVELRKRANVTPEEYEEQKQGLLRAAQTIKSLTNYKQIFNDLNELLRKKGMNPLPEPTDDNLSAIMGQLDASIRPEGISEVSTLCLLNMLYILFKNIYTNHGNPWYGSTDTQKYKVAFEKMNKLRSLNLDADVAEMFFWSIQAIITRGAPDVSKSIPVITADKKAKYDGIYTKIKEILNSQPFLEQDRDVASYILRDLVPAYKNFNRYILQENNTITLLQPSQQANFKRMDISVLFLLFLTYVNKFLTEKRPELEAAGCPTLNP